ncbi:MAG: GHKL domain-containing protein, partial [Lachnospiraceae bacterium]
MKILILILVSVVLLVLVIYLLYRILDGIYDRRIAAYQNKLLKNEVDEVHNLYLTMRGWRHDYHNHMQSVKAYLAMDSLEEARAYLDALEQDLDEINLLFNTGNINADAVLNAKISLAIKKGIQVDYKAAVPKTLAVSDIDLCVVIGNLIDNAVESCEKVAPENQFIRLYIGIFQKQLYLSVSNATSETVRK